MSLCARWNSADKNILTEKGSAMTSTTGRLCMATVLAPMTVAAGAAERVLSLDLAKQHEANEKLQIKELAKGEFEWSLPDGLGQKLDMDLKKLGVDPNDYDELRFDIKPQGSQVGLHATLFGMPTENELTSWYTKFRTATGQVVHGPLRPACGRRWRRSPSIFRGFKAGILRFELYSRIRGYPGEPKWRKAILRNPRLIRWAVAVDFEPRDVKIVTGDKELAYTFPLRLKNRTGQAAEGEDRNRSGEGAEVVQVGAVRHRHASSWPPARSRSCPSACLIAAQDAKNLAPGLRRAHLPEGLRSRD